MIRKEGNVSYRNTTVGLGAGLLVLVGIGTCHLLSPTPSGSSLELGVRSPDDPGPGEPLTRRASARETGRRRSVEHGLRITDAGTGERIAGATVMVWPPRLTIRTAAAARRPPCSRPMPTAW